MPKGNLTYKHLGVSSLLDYLGVFVVSGLLSLLSLELIGKYKRHSKEYSSTK